MMVQEVRLIQERCDPDGPDSEEFCRRLAIDFFRRTRTFTAIYTLYCVQPFLSYFDELEQPWPPPPFALVFVLRPFALSFRRHVHV